MQKRNKTVLLTGGHAGTTALATIQEIKKQKELDWNVVWVGPEYSMEGKKIKSLEFKIFPSIGVVCYPLISGRLQRKWSRYTIPSLLKVPFGLAHSLILLLRIRPAIVLSFGGFAGLPVVMMAFLLRIPVILHEQTVALGLANKLSTFFATKVALAREESRPFFPQKKTIVVGNPLMQTILKIKPKLKIGDLPTIYVTGGSRGAQILNRAIMPALSKLLKEFIVIHQTGELDYGVFEKIHEELDSNLAKRYKIYSFISPLDIGRIYEKADIIISRAGANTVAEILYLNRPSILIPIPWTRYDEQTQNALKAQKLGVAKVLLQKDLTEQALLGMIDEVKTNWKKMASVGNKIALLDKSASRKLVSEMEALLT